MNGTIFKGREYSSPDEMPPDVRRLYDDVMALVAASDSSPGQSKVKIRTRFVVNRKEYSSSAEMPPAIRAEYEKLVNESNATAPTDNAAAAPSSLALLETGTSSSLDSQLRLSAPTRFVLILLVVTVLAAFLLWR
jgi:hypothetical protein